MPPLSRKPGPDQLPIPGQEPRPALVHILTPEFQNIDPTDSIYADIPREYLIDCAPAALQGHLISTKLRGQAVVSYELAGTEKEKYKSNFMYMAVTPREFGLFSRHIPMLAETAISGTLDSRDKKLQLATGDLTAKARTPEDVAASKRAAFREVALKKVSMEDYLKTDILPRRQVIAQFTEMAQYSNLSRSSRATIKERFELLRTFVFGDMMDAVANHQDWNAPGERERRATALQMRLYFVPPNGDASFRVRNFQAMLALADEYYGHKHALVRGRIAQSQKYIRDRPEVAADVVRRDAEKAAEKQAKEARKRT